jgi:hypothetical protein
MTRWGELIPHDTNACDPESGRCGCLCNDCDAECTPHPDDCQCEEHA